jgi:hypothetical protein
MYEKSKSFYSVETQVREINSRFAKAVEKLGKDRSKGSKRHYLEVEFAHILNDIKNSPSYVVPMLLEQAREMIDTANSFS